MGMVGCGDGGVRGWWGAGMVGCGDGGVWGWWGAWMVGCGDVGLRGWWAAGMVGCGDGGHKPAIHVRSPHGYTECLFVASLSS